MRNSIAVVLALIPATAAWSECLPPSARISSARRSSLSSVPAARRPKRCIGARAIASASAPHRSGQARCRRPAVIRSQRSPIGSPISSPRPT